MKKAWLELFDWEMVTATNAALCRGKSALHKPSSDGHERTRALWEESHLRLMTLAEMVDLCRECHRLAPFCNYNGNTFAAIARTLVDTMSLPPDQTFVVRSLVGHVVAGTFTSEELSELKRFSDDLGEFHGSA